MPVHEAVVPMKMRAGLRMVLVACLGLVSVGCAAEVDTPLAASKLVPEGRVLCSNLQFDVPKGWKLEAAGGTRWRLLPPQASSVEAWVVCTDGEYSSFQPPAMRRDSAEHLRWVDKLSAPDTYEGPERALQSAPEKSRDAVLIGCIQYVSGDDRFEHCVWGDPYKREQQRADGYISMRWSSADAAAAQQLAALSASVMRSFTVTPTPERPNDQHP